MQATIQNRVLLVVLFLFLPRGSACLVADEPSDARIQRIETGLHPAIFLAGTTPSPLPPSRMADRMRFYRTPAVSVAVIDNGTLAWARAYGLRQAGIDHPVEPGTLFQAASISKPVAALVVLRLVEQGLLDLDEDVNGRLRTWQVPVSELTATHHVTLRLLLSHRAGLTDGAGFRGVPANQPRPSLRDILEAGRWTPAPVRIGFQPGARFQYSGGGYCLIEQLLEDVTGQPFPTLARELVFDPLEMTDSSFEQPLSTDRADRAARGHRFNGTPLSAGWNDYSATSAAGLWTTPTDLAKFVIALQNARVGRSNDILSQALASDMLSTQGPPDDRTSRLIALRESLPERSFPSWGLGTGLIGRPAQWFFHTGVNPGYQCELRASIDGGQGAIVMTSGDQGWRLGREILRAIAQEYQWPDYDEPPLARHVAPLTSDQLDRFVGRYRLNGTAASPLILNITRDGDALSAEIADHLPRTRLYPESPDRCFTLQDAMTLTFVPDEAGRFTTVISDLGWRARREPDQSQGARSGTSISPVVP